MYCLLSCIIVTVLLAYKEYLRYQDVIDPILSKYVPKQRTWMSVYGRTTITCGRCNLIEV